MTGLDSSEDGLIAAVAPSDLKSVGKMGKELLAQHGSKGMVVGDNELFSRVCSLGADVTAGRFRYAILHLLAERVGLLPPEMPSEVKDVVFNVAAKFPMKRMEPGVVHSGWLLDLQEFVKQIEHDLGVQ